MGFGKEIREKFPYELIPYIFISCFPMLPNALQSISFGLFILFILYKNRVEVRQNILLKYNWLIYLSITGFYFFSLYTFTYSSDFDLDFSIIQGNILICFIPFILVFSRGENLIKIKWMTWTLSLSSIVLLFLIFLFLKEGIELCYIFYKEEIYLKDYIPGQVINYIFLNKFEFLHSIASWGYMKNKTLIELNTHHAYISALLNLNIILLLNLIHNKKEINSKIRITYYLLILFFISTIIFIGSKINIAFLAILLISYILYLINKKIQIRKLLILSFGIGAFILFFSYDENIKNKAINLVDKQLDSERKTLYTKLTPIIKSNLVSGIGINNVGHTIDSLMQTENKIYQYNVLTHLNTPHSQYLFYLLAGGIFQLFLFLLFFGVLSFLFIRINSFYGLTFVLLIFLNCIFEDFLNRVWGVYILSFGLISLWKNSDEI